MCAYLHQRCEQPIVHEAEFNRKGDEDMSLAVADLQKQREEARARLLAKFGGGSLSAPMRFISGAATDMAVPSITGCRPKVRSSHPWSNKSFNCRLHRQAGRASRAISAIRRKHGSNLVRNRNHASHRSPIQLPSAKRRPNTPC